MEDIYFKNDEYWKEHINKKLEDDIWIKNYREYFNGKGKYDEERRVTTYRLDSPIKVTVDNYDSVGYNKDKKNTGTITPSTDFESQWKEKNQDLFKYAGDSAKKSVDKGLKEAPSYMKDADEGTSFENVQTASVKRTLAQDSNNDKLPAIWVVLLLKEAVMKKSLSLTAMLFPNVNITKKVKHLGSHRSVGNAKFQLVMLPANSILAY